MKKNKYFENRLLRYRRANQNEMHVTLMWCSNLVESCGQREKLKEKQTKTFDGLLHFVLDIIHFIQSKDSQKLLLFLD